MYQVRYALYANLSMYHSTVRTLILHDVSILNRNRFYELIRLCDASKSNEIRYTFDDGFVSAYEGAREVGLKHAIWFVCPAFINSGTTNAWVSFLRNNLRRTDFAGPTLQPMTWAQINELVRLGHTIGAHTVTHADLATISSRRELEYEIRSSGDLIEDKIGIPVKHFAFPFGSILNISSLAYSIIRSRYQYCHTGIRGRSILGHRIFWRDAVDLSMPRWYIRFILEGGLDWKYCTARHRIMGMEDDFLNN